MGDNLVGQVTVLEQPGSPDITFGNDRTTAVRVYKGRYADLLAMRPRNGTLMPDIGLVVDDANLKRVAGSGAEAVGILTVSLSDDDDSALSPEVVEERDFDDSLERDIRLHPMYATGGDRALTNSDRAQIALWETEESPSRRAAYQFRYAGTTYTLSTNAQHIALRLLRGQETYRDSVVRARKVTLTRELPECNETLTYTSTKPFAKLPNGLIWLLLRDSATRTGRRGKWTRNQEWLGLKNLDTDFYTAAAS